MIPTELRSIRPESLALYQRGVFGAGALPGAGASFSVPIFNTLHPTIQDYLNYADNTLVLQEVPGFGSFEFERFVGMYLVDLFLFQDQDATLELRERTLDLLTQPTQIPGFTDTTRSVWTRQVSANVPFKQTWRVHNAEVRIVYTNNPTNAVTVFDFQVTARPL